MAKAVKLLGYCETVGDDVGNRSRKRDSMVTEGPAVNSYILNPAARRMEARSFQMKRGIAEEKVMRWVTPLHHSVKGLHVVITVMVVAPVVPRIVTAGKKRQHLTRALPKR
jgi:hypothetical protein